MIKVIALIGSRTIDKSRVKKEILNYLKDRKDHPMIITAGNCQNLVMGVIDASNETSLGYMLEPIQYKKGEHYMASIQRRNKLMMSQATEVLAIWDEESKGTKSEIKLAQKAGKPIKIINLNPKKPTQTRQVSLL